MRVELAGLTEAAGRFAHTYEPGELLLNDEQVVLAGPPTVSGRIIRSAGQVVVEGEVAGLIQVECDRCLVPVALPVETPFKLEYVTKDRYQALPAAEIEEKDLALSVFDGEVIDIDEIAREQLLLAVPFQALCKDDCKGLCFVCGADKNIVSCDCKALASDSRWAELENLRF